MDGPRPALDWIPEACTLPTVEQPVRGQEFVALLRETVLAAQRLDSTRLLLRLPSDPATLSRVADLAAREVQCCSFFHFTLAFAADGSTLTVAVPSEHSAVLDGLAGLR